jgi:hypothetical protein
MMKSLQVFFISVLILFLSSTTLFSQQITLLNPNGGDSLIGFAQYDVKWQSTGVDSVRIDYTTDNGTLWWSWANVPASSGVNTWTVPPNILSSDCRIRIVDMNNPAVRDSSDSTFTIASFVKVLKPNGWDTLFTKRQYEIKWTSVGVTSVWISFTIDDGLSWGGVASNINASDSSYIWTVPEASTTKARIRLRAGTAVEDISDTTFTIISTVGVKETSVNNTPYVFPNPSNGIVNIDFKNRGLGNEVTFKVVDVLGKEVYKTTASDFGDTFTIDLQETTAISGIYYLLISDGFTNSRHKLYIK